MCDDGDPNTVNDMETILTCDGSICVPCSGTAVDCDMGATSVQPCDDNNPCTINDEETVLDSDGTICVPCAGTLVDCDAAMTSVQPCDDGDPCTINDIQVVLNCDGSVCEPCMGEDIIFLVDFAEDNEYEVAVGESVTGNLLLNDDLDNINDPIVQLTTNPIFGEMSINQDGSFEYTPEIDFSETEEFDYIVCSTDCAEECASATVVINIIDDTELFVPDAISPNGDGINDTWIIPGLLDSERRKLTVINRWGDVVYEADPYNNDWDGSNSNSGKPLPEGTYYYLLRHDLVPGALAQGTITIIR
jgi:gliding motility-associated-like protein